MGHAGGAGGPPTVDGRAVFDAAAQVLRTHYAGPAMGEIEARLAAQRRALLGRCAAAPCPLALGRAAVEAVVWSLDDPHTGVNWDAPALAQGAQQVTARRVWSGMLTDLRTPSTLQVVHVDHGGPAERAGLRPGDVVLAVNRRDDMAEAGLRASFLEEAEADQKPYVLRVRRGEQVLTVTVIPASWPAFAQPSLRWRGQVAVISVPNFVPGTGPAFNTLVTRAAAQGAAGLVVDLRWNGGGSAVDCLAAAQSLAGDRVNLVGVGRSGRPLPAWRTTPEAQAARARVRTPWVGPLALLVSARTASCGELLAYFGQRAGGMVVGQPTRGLMSSGTRAHDLPGGGLLFVSDVRPTLDGRVRLPGRVVPDCLLPDDAELSSQGRDTALEEALRVARGTKNCAGPRGSGR
ncbi:S41 family peptidase [Deinococcus arcticus]|uniref:S41 family peptidase n=1 Tax=Deinococcus arcticus TaxID=2136176 RepID=UPI001304A271|nr:S41 family peptidase [Deinococcus arcticus]